MLKYLIFTIIMVLAIVACKKEGAGGDATIRGYVHTEKFNTTFTQYLGEYPARNKSVYIVYGDNTYGYDDHIYTDYNGRFEVPYLYPGDYKVYVYSKDSTRNDPSGTVPVVRDIHISGRKEIVEIDTILIFDVK
jgi:hypothetical protein